METRKKVLHVNAGGETGGGKTHIVSLVSALGKEQAELLVFEEGPVAEAAREAGCLVHVMGQTSRYDLAVLKRLAAFVNQGRYDLVHTHGARANFMVSMIKKKLHAKWVITVHSDPFLDFKGRGAGGKAFELLNVRSLKKADQIIAVAEPVKKQLMEIGVDAGKIAVVHNGITFTHLSSEHPKNDVFTMIYTARLHPVKGHRLLFNSLKAADMPKWKLWLAGDGESRAALEAEAKILDLENHIEFLGWLTQSELTPFLQTADVSLLTSVSETFPLVLLESANEGIPVVATDVGDVKDLLPDPSYGWLVPPENETALAAALQSAYHEWEEGTLPQKGRRFYEWTRAQFSIAEMKKATLAVYQNTLKNK